MTRTRWLLATRRGWLTRTREIVTDPREAWQHLDKYTADLLVIDYVEAGLFASGELRVLALGAPLPGTTIDLPQLPLFETLPLL